MYKYIPIFTKRAQSLSLIIIDCTFTLPIFLLKHSQFPIYSLIHIIKKFFVLHHRSADSLSIYKCILLLLNRSRKHPSSHGSHLNSILCTMYICIFAFHYTSSCYFFSSRPNKYFFLLL